jgi:signal transduction histidine kinase
MVLVGLTALVGLLAEWLLAPGSDDLVSLCAFLLASGVVSLGVVGVVLLFAPSALRTLRGKLLFALMMSAALTAANVAFLSYEMFISSHDLELLWLLLLFSLGMSAFYSVVISRSFNRGMEDLVRVVREMGTGAAGTRANEGRGDEMDELARAFNGMAERLEAAAARQRDLEQARRQLVAAVSHDLRTPLSTMRAMVESINDGVVGDEATIRRYLATMQSEIEYLSRLIDDLFELSQIDAGQLELRIDEADLAGLIADTVDGVAAQAEQRGVDVRGVIDGRLSPVAADARRVQRVLYNLVQNAVRHTPADGTIVIHARDAGGDVEVSVADTGEGIAAADLPYIFDRFNRGGNRARVRGEGGGGLGLSIARGIVELHGGRIWVDSAEGEGATFTFALPKAGPVRG